MNRDQRAIDELIRKCQACLANQAGGDSRCCVEIARRAIHMQNDQAWDALVMLLRPIMLARIFAIQPDISPMNAERWLYRTLQTFKEDGTRSWPRRQPSITSILARLETLIKSTREQG